MLPKNTTTSLPFEIRQSPIAGLGAFAVRRIRKGQRIIEYTGERISADEAARRYDDGRMTRHHTLLFEVDEHTMIDAAVGGNESRYLNHSCAPNCRAVDQDGRIFIEAICNIQPGVELTYDYQYESDESPAEALERYPCYCGAETCRGTIVYPW
jgi:SET domain-containing protein